MSKAAEALAKAIAESFYQGEKAFGIRIHPDCIEAMTRLIDAHPDVKGLVEAAGRGLHDTCYDDPKEGRTSCAMCNLSRAALPNWLPSEEKTDE